MPDSHPTDVCVFAPIVQLTVTIEQLDEPSDGVADDIHVHPGGQGLWIARMLQQLGNRPVLCGPVGGEIGTVLRSLMPEWGIDFAAVEVSAESPAYIHDRRGGDRQLVAEVPPATLDRHAVDDLYGKVLELALASRALVMTAAPSLPSDMYERLGSDLAAAGVRVFGDLHGEELTAFLTGGPIELLKVSHEDLADDGWEVGDESSAVDAIARLREMGAGSVVMSRADQPALAGFPDGVFAATPPELEVVEHRGAGDSMTAGLVSAALSGRDAEGCIRLGSAAGAANVTRHGLGSGSPDLVAELARKVDVRRIEAAP